MPDTNDLRTTVAQELHRRHASGKIPDAVCLDCVMTAQTAIAVATPHIRAALYDEIVRALHDAADSHARAGDTAGCELRRHAAWYIRGMQAEEKTDMTSHNVDTGMQHDIEPRDHDLAWYDRAPVPDEAITRHHEYPPTREAFPRLAQVPDRIHRFEIELHGGRWHARALNGIHMFADEVGDWPSGLTVGDALHAAIASVSEQEAPSCPERAEQVSGDLAMPTGHSDALDVQVRDARARVKGLETKVSQQGNVLSEVFDSVQKTRRYNEKTRAHQNNMGKAFAALKQRVADMEYQAGSPDGCLTANERLTRLESTMREELDGFSRHVDTALAALHDFETRLTNLETPQPTPEPDAGEDAPRFHETPVFALGEYIGEVCDELNAAVYGDRIGELALAKAFNLGLAVSPDDPRLQPLDPHIIATVIHNRHRTFPVEPNCQRCQAIADEVVEALNATRTVAGEGQG